MLRIRRCVLFPGTVYEEEKILKTMHFPPNILPSKAPDILLKQECLFFTRDPFEQASIQNVCRRIDGNPVERLR